MNLQRLLLTDLGHRHLCHNGLVIRIAIALIIAGLTIPASTHAANQADQYANQRIPIPGAKPTLLRKTAKARQVVDADAGSVQVRNAPVASSTPSKHRTSTIARAATGQALRDLPPAPLDGSLVKGHVRQVGYIDGYAPTGCDCSGPVCDCGAEPMCGADGGYIAGPGCGFEPACGCELGVECSCGVEAGCGLEMAPGCGIEGCGIPGCGCDSNYATGPACGVEAGCGMEPVADCGCDACAGAMFDDCYPLFLPVLRINWCRFDFFAGVQAYKGPMNFANVNGQNGDRNGSGSFGFYEGFNEGRSLKRWLGWDLAGQFGLRATQSNLSGSEFTSETRHQIFLTGGLFRRVDYGLQYGFVVDYLNDDWWFQGDLTQIRGELSWNTGRCHLFGLRFAAGTGDDSSNTVVRDGAGALINGTVTFEPTDQYRLFYRRTLNGSGAVEGFAGWTDNDDGILGASLNLPLRQKIVLQTGATYLIANEGVNNGGNEQESWNISLGLIFRPGGAQGCGRYCRPMFDVADNGTFMVDRQ